MNFRVRLDAKKWFDQIRDKPPFKTDFDIFYFCLMAGLLAGRPDQGQGSASTEITDTFTEDYKPQRNLIIGLLVIADLKARGIDVQEKSEVRDTMKNLLDPISPNGLSDEGVRRMNAYSSGGYDYLASARSSKPYSAEEFLRDFVQLTQAAAASGSLLSDRAAS